MNSMARRRNPTILSRRRNPHASDELPYDQWIPAHAVKFNHDGTVSLMTEAEHAHEHNPRTISGAPPKAYGYGEDLIPDLELGNYEYWVYGDSVYGNQIGQRGWTLPEGIPANARMESSVAHWNRFHPDAQIHQHNRGRRRY